MEKEDWAAADTRLRREQGISDLDAIIIHLMVLTDEDGNYGEKPLPAEHLAVLERCRRDLEALQKVRREIANLN